MAGPRMTPQAIEVLRVFLQDPTEPRYGLDIARQAGLKTGTLHPILTRLQQAGLLESFWEDPADHENAKRPRRRYYRLAGHVATVTAHQAVARANATPIGGRPVLRPQHGHWEASS